MNVRIEESFELLSQQEWDDFLAVNYFDNMIIEDKKRLHIKMSVRWICIFGCMTN